MSSGSRFHARLTALAIGATLALTGAAASPALATHFKQSPGGTDPLTIWIGTNGWFQELVAGNTDNSFFPYYAPNQVDVSADAGFVLAFPGGQANTSTDSIEGKVVGWTPSSGSNDLLFDGGNFVPVSQGNWTGNGTVGDRYTLVTVYDVKDGATTLVRVTQTTTYVNGESNFVNSYAVQNQTAADLRFRALVGADVYLNGSDCGSGIFKAGPPRFVGGFSQGRVGGFTEAGTPWTTYFEGQYGGPPGACQTAPRATGVWDYLEGAHSGSGFPSSPAFVDPSFVDNGVGLQWDTRFSTPLPAGEIENFQLNTLGVVPGELTLTPTSQSVNAGSPATLTATATDSAGAAAPNILVRFTAGGANVAGGSATTNSAGQAVLSYTPASGGTDTISAFEDLDGNGVRGASEPNATATVTVAAASSGTPGSPGSPGSPASPDRTPPRITLTAPSKVKLKKFIKGLSVAARVNETASLKFELLGSPPSRRRARAKAFTRVLARQSLAMAGAGLRAARLRPSKKLIGKAKKFAVRLRVTAVDRAGNKTVVTRTIKVR